MSNSGFSSILIMIIILVAIVSSLAFYRLGKKVNRDGKYTKGFGGNEEGNGIAIGVAIGLVLGMLIDNLVLGIALGASIGVAMEAAFISDKYKK